MLLIWYVSRCCRRRHWAQKVPYSWFSSIVYLKIILGLSLKRFSDVDVLVNSSIIMSPNRFQKAVVCLLFCCINKLSKRAFIGTIWCEERSHSPPRPDVCSGLCPCLLRDLEQMGSPPSPLFLTSPGHTNTSEFKITRGLLCGKGPDAEAPTNTPGVTASGRGPT